MRIFAHTAEEIAATKKIGDGFEVIMFSNVLENTLDPVSVLKSCNHHLTNDGVICIHTPNFYYYDAMNPYHPWIFSSESLVNICARAGLKVTNIIEKSLDDEGDDFVGKIQKRDKFSTLFFTPGKAKISRAADIKIILQKQRKALSCS